MRISILLGVALLPLLGCTSQGAQHRALDDAYEAYSAGDCGQVMLSLSQASRYGRYSDPVRPEIALLRGLCLERQALFPDAIKTYEFMIQKYPSSEFSFRARARLETLEQLGHYQPPGKSRPIAAPSTDTWRTPASSATRP